MVSFKKNNTFYFQSYPHPLPPLLYYNTNMNKRRYIKPITFPDWYKNDPERLNQGKTYNEYLKEAGLLKRVNRAKQGFRRVPNEKGRKRVIILDAEAAFE